MAILKNFSLFAAIIVSQGCMAMNKVWVDITKTDVEYIKKAVELDHPGSVDENAAQFNLRKQQAYKQVINQLKYVNGPDDYFNLVNEFVASFADVHMYVNFSYASTRKEWAGIKIERKQKKFMVTKVVDNWGGDLPGVGSRLISCDGHSAEEIMNRDVLRYREANYEQEYPRIKYASKLLIDDGVGYRARPIQCKFIAPDGEEKTLTLQWKHYDHLDAVWDAAVPIDGEFGVTLDGNLVWVRVPTFIIGANYLAQFSSVLKDLESIKNKRSKVIVFDVRGNQGGEISYGYSLLRALYGEDVLVNIIMHKQLHKQPYEDKAFWRVSAGNINFLQGDLTRIPSENGPTKSYMMSLLNEMQDAQKAKKKLVADPGLNAGWQIDKNIPYEDALNIAPKVMVLTDHHCVSACNDFVDLIKEYMPKSQHIGTETYSETPYKGVKYLRLPSYMGWINLPMKEISFHGVFQSIGPFRPSSVYKGDMTDLPKLKNWVKELSLSSEPLKNSQE